MKLKIIKQRFHIKMLLHKPSKLRLKLNHLFFHWYYKRCDEYYRQYTFIKSVKLLISNHNHLCEVELPLEKNIQKKYASEANKLRKELQQIKLNDATNEFRKAGGNPDEFLKNMGFKNLGGKDN